MLCKLHPGLFEEEPSALSCHSLLRDCVYYASSFYTGVCSVHLGSSFGQGL